VRFALGRVTTTAIAAATTVGASKSAKAQHADPMARAEITSPTLSTARAQAPSAAKAKLSAARTIRTTYRHTISPLCVDDPGIDDQVDHAPCSGGLSKDPWQHGTIMSLGSRTNHPPTAPMSQNEGLPYDCRETPWPFDVLELWPRPPYCPAMLSAYPNSAPRMPMTLRKMTIPTMTTAIKRKIRNQKQPL
jgi:hypothetical protein